MPEAKHKSVRVPAALIGVGVLVVALGFGIPLLTSQPTPAPQTNAPTPPAPADMGIALLRLVAALAIVCGLCVVATRWLGRSAPVPMASTMQVIASLRVGRCAVLLVCAGERRLLIGTDPSGVKALVELPGPEPESLASAAPTEVGRLKKVAQQAIV